MMIPNEELEQVFKELIYCFGEINWNIIKTESWNKYINENKNFNEKQFEELRYVVNELKELIEKYEKN